MVDSKLEVVGHSRREWEGHGTGNQQTGALLQLAGCVTLASQACLGDGPTYLTWPSWSSKETKPGRQPVRCLTQRMSRYREVSVCLCSHRCGPGRRHFSFLMLLFCRSGHVMWSPAYNCTLVCGSAVARETFGQEASADGWQPLHTAWFYLTRCP